MIAADELGDYGVGAGVTGPPSQARPASHGKFRNLASPEQPGPSWRFAFLRGRRERRRPATAAALVSQVPIREFLPVRNYRNRRQRGHSLWPWHAPGRVADDWPAESFAAGWTTPIVRGLRRNKE